MKLQVDEELKNICTEIISENKTDAEWSEIESCDMFQTEHYCGGYDSIENEFCFSYYDLESKEYWFQISLVDLSKIVAGEINEIEIRIPD